jgi:hypothetical protein
LLPRYALVSVASLSLFALGPLSAMKQAALADVSGASSSSAAAGKKTAAQNTPAPEKYCRDTEVRKLPGRLNETPCFNSNSPEMVLNDGILLSTFPPEGMTHPEAHLNYAFDGKFDIFSHHVARSESDSDDRILYLGFIAANPSNRKVHLRFPSGASYVSQPDAPFVTVSELCLNNDAKIFAGPGDRVNLDLLRHKKAAFLPREITIAPGQTKLIFTLPVPVRQLRPALNGRSTLVKAHSSGPIYLASVARLVSANDKDALDESHWLDALKNDQLSSPRDVTPTPPGAPNIKFGRVSGVVRGTEWDATLTDGDADLLTIPAPGASITYPFSTVEGGTFGTGQAQSAEMIVRYPDTAYAAHGNYGVTYRFTIPLHNPYEKDMDVQLLFQSAIKSNQQSKQLCFYEAAAPRAFFRGTVRLNTDNKKGNLWHLVQKQGAEGAKLAEVSMPPGSRRNLRLEFVYPPDATPPQQICIKNVTAAGD